MSNGNRIPQTTGGRSNTSKIYTPSSVQIISDKKLFTIIDIPFEAIIGSYTIKACNISIPGTFLDTDVRILRFKLLQNYSGIPIF
ncbi:MAG: hypothetical protein H0S84_12650 [Bacteroidales bacterium]|jgi:hypothetical protein|nr:hypothetical protein [Bacteroidales bacterium]MDN5349085.1 hypothetical protein [Bacteroidales bacterium]